MKSISIALAYCIDNLPIAEGIEKALTATNYSFVHHYCSKNSAQGQILLADQLQKHEGPIILLISDNFLKSLNCMNRALKLIQTKAKHIIPVVVDGRKMDESTGQFMNVPTKFEKIGDIIPYINYWQNQYLDLRSQRKSIESEVNFNKDAFGEHLRTLRQVSSEASEFLRVLRNMVHYSYADFSDDHFEALFRHLEQEEDWEAFKAKVPVLDTNYAKYKPQPSDEAPTEKDTEIESDTEEELPDLSDIPGINLLEGGKNIAKIIQNRNEPEIDPVALPNEEEDLEEEEHLDAEKTVDEPLSPPSSEVVPPEVEVPEEDEEEDEEDFLSELLGEEEIGGPASSKDNIEEEHAVDEDPSPEDLNKEAAAEPILSLNSDEDDAPDEEPFEDEETNESKTPLDLSELFDQQKEDFDLLNEPNLEESETTEEKIEDELLEIETNAAELIDQAFAMASSGQIEDGVTLMREATNQFPEDGALRYHFALMLAQSTSDFSSAIQQLEILFDQDSEHIEGNFLMGELAEIQESYSRATKYYKKVTKVDPSFQNVYTRMGIVEMQKDKNDPKKALKYFKKALKINPTHVDANYQYALLLNEVKGKPKKAIKYLQKTVDLHPQHPFANYDLALLHYQMDNLIDARYFYQKAIAINPELKTKENDLAFGNLSDGGQRHKAKKAFSTSPENPEQTETIKLEEKDSPTPPIEEESEALAALKANIKKLEALLAEKVEQEKYPNPNGQTVLITGSTSGIGRATAFKFAAEGYRLILNGRRIDRLEALKAEFEERYRSEVLLLPFDVSDLRAVRAAIDNLPIGWQDIDILINNAGKAKGFAPIHEGQVEHWEEMIEVNVKGLLYLTRTVSPNMVSRGAGHIINVCSTAGKEVYPNGNVYCATKFAVDALTKAIRLDLYKYDIKVSQVSPAHVEETEFALVRFDGDAQRAKIYEDFNPLTSPDVAESIYFIVNQPKNVNIQDILLMGTQQAGSTFINRSGRDEEE
ncbi:MAG: hypothetical protein Sapg2KO_07930 [Saprospiraceae bacterium]